MSEGFTCDRCSHCCRSHRVPLTAGDLARLEAAGHELQTCIELLSPEDVDMTGEPESFAVLREGRRAVFLRHVDEEETSRCVFLVAGEGCSVHTKRPAACRTYPYDRGADDEDLGLVPSQMCPDETGILVTLRASKDDHLRKTFVTEVRKRDRELLDFTQFIESWNRRQRTRLRMGRLPQDASAFLQALREGSGDAT